MHFLCVLCLMQCNAMQGSADIHSNTPHINTIKHSNGDATNLKRERERPNLNIVNILTIRIEEAKPLSYTNKSFTFLKPSYLDC